MQNHMVSVIITAKDQVHQVEASIRSVVNQDFGEDYEIIVIDDGSIDGTAGEIRRIFGKRVRTVEKDVPDGWLRSISTACQEAKGELLAVCDPHCRVKPDWLDTIVKSFRSEPELSIMTGPAFHGYGLMQKLSALTSHAQFISSERGSISYIFDDNFAIRKDTLIRLLPKLPVEKNLNDAVGCALLSSQAKQQGIPVFYEPRMAAFHVSPDFMEYLGEWKNITAETTIDIRLLDPNARGASLSRHLSLVPFIYPCVRILLDVRNAWHFRKELRLTVVDFPLLLMADAAGKVWYCAGLVSTVKKRMRIEPGGAP